MLGAQCQQQWGQHSGAISVREGRAVGQLVAPPSPLTSRGVQLPYRQGDKEQRQPAQSCLKFLPQGGSCPFQPFLYTVKKQKENEVFGDFFHFSHKQ